MTTANQVGRRMAAGLVGPFLILVYLVGSASDAAALLEAVICLAGSLSGLAFAWRRAATSGRDRPTWREMVGASLVSTPLALFIVSAVVGGGVTSEAFGIALGAGIATGLLYGGALTLIVYAARGPAITASFE